MDLVPALPLPLANGCNPERSLPLGETLAGAIKLDPLVPAEHKTAGAAHFADILGQTLAGPLFATWTPTPEIVAINKPTANQAQVGALDPNGRRDGRKRSRR